jgi:transposase
MTRRRQEGKSKKEVIRCLKRYVAREVFAVLRPMSCEGRVTGCSDCS